MRKYIEMNALIEFANNHKEGKIDSNDIARFPISDVQAVKHGKWIEHKDELGATFECSVCHVETCSDTSFCPHCGAEMQKSFEIGQTKLSDVAVGDTFKIGDVTYIKFLDINGVTVAVTKDIVFNSEFGKNNNFAGSEILKKLVKEFLPKVSEIIGDENIVEFETDLTTLDGLKPYAPLKSKISLPTFDFYRQNVQIFDKHMLDNYDNYWWLATPDTASPHYEPNWVTCVCPSGFIESDLYTGNLGVRPLLNFVSSISVSCED